MKTGRLLTEILRMKRISRNQGQNKANFYK